MTKHYNKTHMMERRRKLRSNMTFCEKIVWTHIRRKQLGYRFLRQYSVDNYIIDFYCPELKLAIEVDGAYHNDPDQMIYDKKRQKHIEEFGLQFIRITNEELQTNPNKTFAKIEDMIRKMENCE